MLKNLKQFDEFHINEEVNPVPTIERALEPDRKGRDIRLGIKLGNSTMWLPVVNIDELKTIKDMIENFIKTNK